jgi:hypothetical protein
MGNKQSEYNFDKLLENDEKTKTHCLVLNMNFLNGERHVNVLGTQVN